jgi:hypothetical protein
MDPQGKFIRAFDTDMSGDGIADALRELMAKDVMKERNGVIGTQASADRGTG